MLETEHAKILFQTGEIQCIFFIACGILVLNKTKMIPGKGFFF